MKKILSSFWLLTGIMAVGLGAQSPAPGQKPTPEQTQGTQTPSPTTAQSASGDKTVTLSGCLQKGTAAHAYMFTPIPSNASGRAGGPVSAAPVGAGAGSTYNVMAATGSKLPPVDLTTHVGHHIELTGTVTDAPASATGGASAGGQRDGGLTEAERTDKPSDGTPGTGAKSEAPLTFSGMSRPTLYATSVKAIAASCAP